MFVQNHHSLEELQRLTKVRVSHFSWAQSDCKRGRAYPARFFRGCAHPVVSRKSVMNIMNNYLCAENSALR